MEQTNVTIQTAVGVPIEKVWTYWTSPEHIVQWNSASDDWHSPNALNDLRENGRFSYRMESKDGKEGFDFTGTYDEVVPFERIAYTLDDGRKVLTSFTEKEGKTEIVSVFEAENTFPVEMQKAGWQAILDRFKDYAESRG